MAERLNKQEMVSVMVPGRNMKDATPIPVTVNGKRWLVPVNRRVDVPKAVAEVLNNRAQMLSIAMMNSAAMVADDSK